MKLIKRIIACIFQRRTKMPIWMMPKEDKEKLTKLDSAIRDSPAIMVD